MSRAPQRSPGTLYESLLRRCVPFCTVLALLVGMLTGCSRKSVFTDDNRIKVISTIFVGYDFARQLGGEKTQSVLLLKPGCEAHSFEPTPADIIAIEECDVFICTGGENDAWVDTILESIDNPDMKIIRMTECVDTLLEEEEVEGMQEEGGALMWGSEEGHHHAHSHTHIESEGHEGDDHDHDEDEDHDHDKAEDHDGEVEFDEHVWMSPVNAACICNVITDAFCEIDNASSDYYTEKNNEYLALLGTLDNKMRSITEAAGAKEIVFADRFPAKYFTEYYGIKYYAAFPGCSENTEASAATVAFIINKVREDRIPIVLTIELSSGQLARAVAEETGAEVCTFYTGHNVTAEDFESGVTFTDLMYRNLSVLEKALN